ncbi:hypothetical protein JYU34_011869 [Plutella xylostella]|uniref:C2H2-type domain-containing protein n=1 Tax=Plutella xylostella TaxID=51655 RepID=A0ABQ7QEM1_PLUXY|nr:hypothetical protein JYU34_011869 [Plutella xylostella]
MDANLSFFSLPFGDANNGDISFSTKSDFHHSLPSGSLLEAEDVLKQFLSTDDPLEEPDLNGPTTLHCEICHKKFDNAKKYYGHLRVHSKDNLRLWVCDKCPDQRFSTKQQLMKHSLTHKPLEKVWKCQQCPSAFEALYRLQQHLFVKHLNYRPHKCDECGKAFQKLSDLKIHGLLHKGTAAKKHKCATCGKVFNHVSNYNRHLTTHSDEKTYRCYGCGRAFKQSPSLTRHTKNCEKYQSQAPTFPKCGNRQNHCRECGMIFQYKSELVEHCISEHSNQKSNKTQVNDTVKETKPEEKVAQKNEAKSTVDNIVDDILSVEDEYSIANQQASQSEILNVAIFDKSHNFNTTEATTADNLMHIEFMKEMNQLHTLDDELFYNDIDFDSFHPGQVFNTNDIDYGAHERNEILFDFADAARGMDHDLMNALYQVKNNDNNLPDELLNAIHDVPEFAEPADSLHGTTDTQESTQDPVSVNECSTIFESDVDLEASTNLAMNLNQLIGENNVQYVSTEDDDTFIISLNSGYDAEKLSDMLNIDVELIDESNEDTVEEVERSSKEEMKEADTNECSIVLKIPEIEEETKSAAPGEVTESNTKKKVKVKVKKQVIFVCRKCNKVFARKENWQSHMGTHDASLRRHRCRVCGLRFSYRSTLNKHCARAHEPRALPALPCALCRRVYTQPWMVPHGRASPRVRAVRQDVPAPLAPTSPPAPRPLH